MALHRSFATYTPFLSFPSVNVGVFARGVVEGLRPCSHFISLDLRGLRGDSRGRFGGSKEALKQLSS
jgi:hypothetical protein